MSDKMIGQRGFRVGIGYSRESVGLKIEASASSWGSGLATAKLSISGALTPDDAIAFGKQLIAKARAVRVANEKRAAEEPWRQASQAWLACQQGISWR